MKARAILIGAVLGLMAGCGPRGEAPGAPAPGPVPAPPANTAGGNSPAGADPQAPPAGASRGDSGSTAKAPDAGKAADTGALLKLPVDKSAQISVALPRQSLAVVEYYDRALSSRGWKKREPKGDEDPGRREWLEMPVPAGPTDLYDAAWVDPKSGRVAVLNLFHTKEQPDLQQGSFEIYAKGQEPWKQ